MDCLDVLFLGCGQRFEKTEPTGGRDRNPGHGVVGNKLPCNITRCDLSSARITYSPKPSWDSVFKRNLELLAHIVSESKFGTFIHYGFSSTQISRGARISLKGRGEATEPGTVNLVKDFTTSPPIIYDIFHFCQIPATLRTREFANPHKGTEEAPAGT